MINPDTDDEIGSATSPTRSCPIRSIRHSSTATRQEFLAADVLRSVERQVDGAARRRRRRDLPARRRQDGPHDQRQRPAGEHAQHALRAVRAHHHLAALRRDLRFPRPPRRPERRRAELDREPQHETPSQTTTCRFKRYVAPNPVRLDGLPANTDEIALAIPSSRCKRPLLGYPAVVFTGKYAPIRSPCCKAASDAELVKHQGPGAFGIADPDVESVEITVEVQTLKMDNMMSVSGRESYIKFYTTTRTVPEASAGIRRRADVPLEYRDCKVLKFGDPADLGDLGVNQAEHRRDGRARAAARAYHSPHHSRPSATKSRTTTGWKQPDHNFNTRYGRTIQFLLHAEPLGTKPGCSARRGTCAASTCSRIRPSSSTATPAACCSARKWRRRPTCIQRLAQQLGVDSKGLTLVGKKGQRVQFGCSHRIRHTLSPDNSSITFASKADLANHWLCGITLELERDWTWDATGGSQRRDQAQRSASRKTTRRPRPRTWRSATSRSSAPRRSPRSATRPQPHHAHLHRCRRNPRTSASSRRRTPGAAVSRSHRGRIHRSSRSSRIRWARPTDDDITLSLELPITPPPAQVPKIVSAGLALSPYVHTALLAKPSRAGAVCGSSSKSRCTIRRTPTSRACWPTPPIS